MAYVICEVNGYILGIGQNQVTVGGVSESEYNAITEMFQNRPIAPDGYTYKLRADNLEWELVELPPIESEPLTDEQALTRYANELTGQNDPDLISAAETLIGKYSGSKDKAEAYDILIGGESE